MIFLSEVVNIAIKIKKKYQGRSFEKDDIIYNEKIYASVVLVINAEGQNIGEMKLSDALKMAYDQELDLVQVSKNQAKPVTKITDYGKYRFEKRKRQQEVKKNQKIVENKEVRLTTNIGAGDLEVKIKKTREFIEKGSNVKVSLKFKGREMANKENGFKTMEKFLKGVEDICVTDKTPSLRGYFLDAHISPKK